jgi:hypothetical protein
LNCPEQPIEAELLEIVLRDLDELRLDLYLPRTETLACSTNAST